MLKLEDLEVYNLSMELGEKICTCSVGFVIPTPRSNALRWNVILDALRQVK